VAVGPLIEQIRASTGMSSTAAGALTTIPLICMCLFAFAGPLLIERVGSGLVAAGSLTLITVGTLLRAAAPSAELVLAATLPIGIGIGILGVTMPVLVQQYFPDRSGTVTGAYVASLSVGITLVALTIVPIADALDGWRVAFVVTALPAAITIPFWARANRGGDPPEQPGQGRWASRWRDPSLTRTIATLAVCFGLQAMCFYGMVSWIAAVYIDAGWSESAAAVTTASIGFLTIAASLTVPRLSEGRDRRTWIAGAAGLMAVGGVGIGVVPTDAWWLWVFAFGFGSGATFALLLALPLDLEASSGGVAVLSSSMQGLGYGLAALAPALVGAARDITGEIAIPVAFLGVIAMGCGAAALAIPRPALRAHASESPA
jgi:CP family cyanate transporter-like MFS transporter